MKTREFRAHDNAEDFKRATKLNPIKKSGKERHQLYSDDDEELDELDSYKTKHESVLDYYDDEEEN